MRLVKALNQFKSSVMVFMPWLLTTGFSGLMLFFALQLLQSRAAAAEAVGAFPDLDTAMSLYYGWQSL